MLKVALKLSNKLHMSDDICGPEACPVNFKFSTEGITTFLGQITQANTAVIFCRKTYEFLKYLQGAKVIFNFKCYSTM